MELSLTYKLSNEQIKNIFITALEGGSNYWYLLERKAVEKIRKAVPNKAIPLSEAMYLAVVEHGVDIEINDIEDEKEILGVVSMKTMQERIQKRIEDNSIAWAMLEELNDNGDASSSDVIFQVMVMGEVQFG